MAIKDQYDTFDMRTTSGADAFYANDRPPDDATFVKRLREAGAIILAKANLGEYASAAPRSSFGGTFCNPYDTEREPARLELGIRLVGRRQSGHLRDRRGDPASSIRGPAGAASAVGIAPTQELVSRDGMIQVRHQHARRSDLPHGGGCRAGAGRDRGLRPEGRAHRVQHRPHADAAVRELRAAQRGSTACASASSAST